MADEPISYEKLMAAYASVEFTPHIVSYEIDTYGVVHFIREDGSWGGMTSRAGLQYLLDNQVKENCNG